MNDAKGSAASHRGLTVGIIACAVVAVIGVALWMVQLSGGMIQTGMRNLDSWGFYITLFMFFVGLSAGGLIISSIPNAFGMKGFGDISRVAIWTSICCTCVAIGFVVVDLGGPLRLWELFVYSNLSSPLMWDIIVLSTYLILSIVYLWAYRREDEGKMSHTAIRVISIIALVVAVGVHTVTAWIFSLSAAHEEHEQGDVEAPGIQIAHASLNHATGKLHHPQSNADNRHYRAGDDAYGQAAMGHRASFRIVHSVLPS